MKLKRNMIILAVVAALSVASIVVLYWSSEDIMSNENPFIRRYVPNSANKVAEIDLGTYGFYFSGSSTEEVFLGHVNSPLVVVEVNSALRKRTDHKIILQRQDLPFRATQIKVIDSNFYFIDGTVPVIYKGSTANWQAKIVMDANHYFSKTEVIDRHKLAFQGQDKFTKENTIGVFDLKDSIKVKFSTHILEKQIDGIFDTDGMLLYSHQMERFIYVYFYRNQYVVCDSSLNVISRGRTIDTTTVAKLSPIKLKSTGERKLAAKPYIVNLHSAVANNLLFLHSPVKGRFQDSRTWKQASSIDVYDLSKNVYISSFYIFDEGRDKLSGMYATNTDLYVIVGTYLQKYKLNKNHFPTIK